MMQIAVLIIIMLKPWIFEKMCRATLRVTSYISSVRPVWYDAPSNDHRETQLPHRISVGHHCSMKYQLGKGRGKCTYKGWSEGVATYVWMVSESLSCTGVHITYNVTSKVPYKFFLHSVQEEFYEMFFCDLNDDDNCTKCSWIMLFTSQRLGRCKWNVNDIEFRFRLEDFYYGLLLARCRHVVTINCFNSNLRPYCRSS